MTENFYVTNAKKLRSAKRLPGDGILINALIARVLFIIIIRRRKIAFAHVVIDVLFSGFPVAASFVFHRNDNSAHYGPAAKYRDENRLPAYMYVALT